MSCRHFFPSQNNCSVESSIVALLSSYAIIFLSVPENGQVVESAQWEIPWSILKTEAWRREVKEKEEKEKGQKSWPRFNTQPNWSQYKQGKETRGGRKEEGADIRQKKLGGLVAVVVVFTRKWSVATREQEKQHKKPKWKEVNTFFQIK